MLQLEQLETRTLLSVIISDTIGPNDDLAIPFGNIPFGDNSNTETITLTNSGEDTIGITSIILNSDNFTITNTLYTPADNLPITPEFIPETDSITSIEFGEIIPGVVGNGGDSVWFEFQAPRNTTIEAQTLIDPIELFDPFIEIYSSTGEVLASNEDINTMTTPAPNTLSDSHVLFATPYYGTYYLRLFSQSPTATGTIPVTIDNTEQSLVPEEFDSGEIELEGTLLPDQFSTDYDWYKFSADYGTILNFDYSQDITDSAFDVNLAIYNTLGERLATSPISEVNNLDVNMTNTGDFFLSLEAEDLGFITTPEPINYSLTISENGIFDVPDIPPPPPPGDPVLNPNDQVEIFVKFSPSNSGNFEDIVTVTTHQNDAFDIQLTGTGLPGDLGFSKIILSNLNLGFITPPDSPLNLTSTISNDQFANISQSSQINYYLSKDQLFDLNDILLSPVEGSTTGVAPIGGNSSINVNHTVQIPADATGINYIIGIIDKSNTISESNETNNTIVSQRINVSDARLDIFDSQGASADLFIDFGLTTLGNNTLPENIEIFNLTDNEIRITDWSMGLGDSSQFHPVTTNIAGNDNDDFIIPGNSSDKIFLVFSPLAYPEMGSNLTDTFLFNLDILESPISIDLAGKVDGPSMFVLEEFGTPNDDILELGDIPLADDLATQTYTITLSNRGDDPLNITNIKTASGKDIGFEQGFSIAAGQQQDFDIVLPIDNIADTFEDTLTIVSNDGINDGLRHIPMTWQTVTSKLVVTDSSLPLDNDQLISFGNVPISTTSELQFVTLSNIGTAALEINGIQIIDKDDENLFSIVDSPFETFPAFIAPNESVDIPLAFMPTTLSNALFTDMLNIQYKTDQSHLVSLEGFSGTPDFSVIRSDNTPVGLDDTIILSPVLNGSNSTQEILIVNDDDLSNPDDDIVVPVTITSISIEGLGFSLLNNPVTAENPITLQSGDILDDLTIQFDSFGLNDLPSEAISGRLFIEGTFNREIPLEVSVVSPQISFPDNDDQGQNFGSIQIGEDSEDKAQTISIQNTGNSPLVIDDFIFSNQQFSILKIRDELDKSIALSDSITIQPSGSQSTVHIELVYRPTQVNSFVGDDATFKFTTNVKDDENNDTKFTINLEAESPGLPFLIDENTTAAFRDADGNLVKVSIKNGSGQMFLENGQGSDANITTLKILNGSDKTTVNIITSGGLTEIGNIESDSSLASITGKNVQINNSIDIDGSLASLTLNRISDQADIHIHDATLKSMQVKVDRIGDDVHLDLASDIRLLQAGSIGTNGEISAKSFKQVKITEGDLGSDIIAFDSFNGNIDKVNVAQNITGNIFAQFDIGKVSSKNGSIAGNITAGMSGMGQQFAALHTNHVEPIEEGRTPSGNIKSLKAKTGISGSIIALDNINKVDTKNGVFSATVRGDNINSIRANAMDGAVISAADTINTISIATNIFDSHVLAGLDIGFDGIAAPNDELTAGDILNFQFGGTFANTHVAIGTIPIFSPLFPLGSNQTTSSGQGSLSKISLGDIATNNQGDPFGFYYAQNVPLNLIGAEQGNFVVFQDTNTGNLP